MARRHDEGPAPGFADIDAWGLRHVGRVRADNQDHFFVGAVAAGGIAVDGGSTALEGVRTVDPGGPGAHRLASLAVVADGVGGRSGGEQASRIVVDGLVGAVARSFEKVASPEVDEPDVFSRLLHDAALHCHATLRGLVTDDGARPATTATLFLGLWPHAYLLQVGDSRCYLYQDGDLRQITRDQTWVQDLVDAGVMSRTSAERSRWAGVLSSAVGADAATPVVSRITRTWGAVVLLCSDGLTKHVSDTRIQARLSTMTGARPLAEQLLLDALEDGGSDNVTIVVGRTLKPQS